VPVARFSKRFYDQLGDEVARELVDWLNASEESHRGELRARSEASVQRFEATVRDGFAVQDARLDKRLAEFEARADKRFAEFDVRFAEFEARTDKRFAEFDVRFAEFEARTDKRFAEFDARFAAFEARTDQRFGEIDARLARFELTLERRLGEQTRWFFVAWAALLIPIIGFGMRG
jgi:hypothetical protein